MSSAAPETTQFITFSLANYLFAIPSHQTVKVIPTPPLAEGGLLDLGLIQLAQYSIQMLNLPKLIDLTHKFSASRPLATAENRPFLLVLQNAQKSLFGITLANPPDLLEIPSHTLQTVPEHQRQSATLQWVSHVAAYTTGATRKIVLILDLPILQ